MPDEANRDFETDDAATQEKVLSPIDLHKRKEAIRIIILIVILLFLVIAAIVLGVCAFL
ncbi:MAG: hypothetical protein WC344_02675 [Bacilli bacterium]|jgi:flagellar basal body-associated protein FliL